YHSLEVRVPFLSNRMLDYSLSCSYNQCIKEEQGKMILKNSLAEKTNSALVFKPKKGFTIPLDAWIRKDLQNDIIEKIMDMPTSLSVFFHKQKLDQLLKEHMNKMHNWGWFIWALYALVNWNETHRNKYRRECA